MLFLNKVDSGKYLYRNGERWFYYDCEDLYEIENTDCLVLDEKNGCVYQGENVFFEIPANCESHIDSLHLQLTNKCNFQCPHCIVSAGPKCVDSLEFDLVKRMIEELLEYGLERVNISGGEPTLYEGLAELFDFCLSRGLSLEVTTNGTNFDLWRDLSVDSLTKLSVRVSMYGDDTDYNTMHNYPRRAILETIEYLHKYAKATSVLLPEIELFNQFDNIEFCKKNGFHFELLNVFALGRHHCPPVDPNDLNLSMVNIKPGHFPCSPKKLAVLATGEVVFCPSVETALGVFGNYKQAAKDLVESQERLRFVDKININKKDSCRNCHLKYLCRGGCLVPYVERDDLLEHVHPYCPFKMKGGEEV